MKTPVGGDLRAMGSDIDKGFFGGYGERIYNAINSPFNIFGSGIFGNKQNIVPVQEQVVQPDPVIVPKPDPIIRSPHVDPTPIPPPPAATNEAEVAYGGNVRDAGGSTTGSYGGGEDFGSPVKQLPSFSSKEAKRVIDDSLKDWAKDLRKTQYRIIKDWMSKAKSGTIDYFDIVRGIQVGDMSRAHPNETKLLLSLLNKDI